MDWIKSVNWKQLFTGLKAALAAGGPSIISLMQVFGYPASNVEKIIAAATTIVGIVLLIIDKSTTNMVLDAKEVPGVQVHVDTSFASPAPQAVITAALDPTVTDVLPMVGGPRHDPQKTS